MAHPAARAPGGANPLSAPLSARRRWQSVCVATLLLLPAFWGMLAGIVTAADGRERAQGAAEAAPDAAAAFALGVAVVPFVFVVLAFMSHHPRAPVAVLQAMGLALAVGLVTMAMFPDGVTGIVAGVGAGGVLALRSGPAASLRPRALGVVVATAYTVFLVRTVPEMALMAAPVFPLTAVGLADELVERHAGREAQRREGEGARPVAGH